ncbi:ELM1/GtrOC1 family putative glycosyltransferase [Acuticoccus mangrovi]|uniref:Mitochondrial fission ELM1 family protein n=1 Tax=Acuticoccus mangrovi TaxID=2796142 RepID=A0A934IM65_9HYPH|nr:ELM1/GtrOC1 family putative glycosyltransferase [Acuticoccus mangrovi]MBJ3777481.1 mitochondrial fission ELM1 family protein [Acuticoccus mangrovi]
MTDVLVLTDGVAGHDRASDGVLAALSRHHTTEAGWLGIAEVRPRSRRIARTCAALGAPEAFLSRNTLLAPDRVAPTFASRRLADWPARADIVLSTGPSTAAANIAAARKYGARNIYCGFAKWPVLGFSMILSPVVSRSPHVAFAPRPTRIDADALPRPRHLVDGQERRIALLFGGETKHYAYTERDMDALAEACRALLEARPTWSLVVFDSRRTASRLFDRVASALAPLAPRATVHRFTDGGIASNAEAFSADIVLVSADSLTMVTEAIAAGRPTLVVRADAYRGPDRDVRELADLAAARMIGRTTFGKLDLAALHATPMPTTISQPAALSALLQSKGF